MTEPTALPRRQDVPQQYTWDLTALYPTEDAFNQALQEFAVLTKQFITDYTGQITDAASALKALPAYAQIQEMQDHLGTYAFLPQSTDLTNAHYRALSVKAEDVLTQANTGLTFFISALSELSDAALDQIAAANADYAPLVRHIRRDKKIRLAPATEAALAQLEPTLDAFATIYGQTRSADMHFPDFTVAGKTYPLSFTMYEDLYAYSPDTKVRRAAFAAFSHVLAQYQNTVAANYYAQVMKEKRLATLRGFDSVVDYLVYDQEVPRSMFDRQIDLITNEFGPIMQKYVKHLQKERGLDQMTFADRLIDLDPDFAPSVSIDQSKDYISKAVAQLGQPYHDMIMHAYPERWVDFVGNQGKETGGFCAQPYRVHPYILMSWTHELADVYTLVHELGHAGQGILSADKHGPLAFTPSGYIIEAPSTFNELLLTNSLIKGTDDPRMQRFAYTKLLTNTYFHNFITHLLEAAYQREVYAMVDRGEAFDAKDLNAITRTVFKRFWGDALQLDDNSDLTWMRQSHYYMGLYSYTYSASLTVSTQAFLRIRDNQPGAVQNWLDFLTLGDSKDPIDSAKVAGVDITTDAPLHNTIQYLGSVVDQVIKLSQELDH
ncbi:oligoendopeptidase F [Schleiferilactobacillus harbinensis]|uniref:oligoendopeptidase F n=1 Tax=Schleiferilactobacillus harbinensis TaxID=304207 RepID=UPI0007B837A2|nr:oligoendopeptidase F [Schleiferilactobacillus harbinensis]